MALDILLQVWHTHRNVILALVFAAIALLYRAQRIRKETGPTEHEIFVADEKQVFDQTFVDVARPQAIRVLQQAAKPSGNPPASPGAKRSAPPKRILGSKARKRAPTPPKSENIQPLVFYSSLSGSTERSATSLVEDLASSLNTPSSSIHAILKPQLHDLSQLDYDDFFTSTPESPGSRTSTSYFYIVLLPTYDIDTTLDNFLEHLKEVHHDFRIDTGPLRSLLGYAVFGFGDKEGWPTDERGFCSQATEVDKWLARLTGHKRAYPVGVGDVKQDADARLNDWRKGVEGVLQDLASGRSLGEGVVGSGDPLESDEEASEGDEEMEAVPKQKRKRIQRANVTDLETIGDSMNGLSRKSIPPAIDFTTTHSAAPPSTQPTLKEMVPTSSPTYTSLTKQGYSIIGSHSGVKICRWTKSALRGRGSCYKYSFYGISSHLCMETTPSLSCSNKCVFCWRHGTNPVGTTWRWKVDPPDLIFDGAKKAHYSKIRMMRGVPGVRAERFEEAMQIRHCALSLVGEPIFYPHINDFVALLHNERISSFLVCNAQHPAQLAALNKVTQLYVSIDASNKDELRKIDRPLHRDFWERFTACLDILREKRFVQRTVFRLTLVKGFNLDEEAEGYAELVARGLPCLVEVKGVTYCGTSTSKGAGLSMANVPFYDEVCTFVVKLNNALARRGLAYGIAAEHSHSCCILLASERFRQDGIWCTTIDYVRFFELLESGEGFAPEDYMAPTPSWALWGNGGFDPRDERVDRKGRPKAAKGFDGSTQSTEMRTTAAHVEEEQDDLVGVRGNEAAR